MPIKLRVDNDCELVPSDLGMLLDARRNLERDHTRLLDWTYSRYAASRTPMELLEAIQAGDRQRAKIKATEYMVDIAIDLIKEKKVSTISELSEALEHEINYNDIYFGITDKAKAAQDIVNLLQPR